MYRNRFPPRLNTKSSFRLRLDWLYGVLIFQKSVCLLSSLFDWVSRFSRFFLYFFSREVQLRATVKREGGFSGTGVGMRNRLPSRTTSQYR